MMGTWRPASRTEGQTWVLFKEGSLGIFSFGVFGSKYVPRLSLLFLEKDLDRLTDLASLILPHTISVT